MTAEQLFVAAFGPGREAECGDLVPDGRRQEDLVRLVLQDFEGKRAEWKQCAMLLADVLCVMLPADVLQKLPEVAFRSMLIHCFSIAPIASQCTCLRCPGVRIVIP